MDIGAALDLANDASPTAVAGTSEAKRTQAASSGVACSDGEDTPTAACRRGEHIGMADIAVLLR
jgi:hypothetical protein